MRIPPTTQTRTTTTRRVLACALSSVLLLAACGGGGDDESAGPAPAHMEQATRAPAHAPDAGDPTHVAAPAPSASPAEGAQGAALTEPGSPARAKEPKGTAKTTSRAGAGTTPKAVPAPAGHGTATPAGHGAPAANPGAGGQPTPAGTGSPPPASAPAPIGGVRPFRPDPGVPAPPPGVNLASDVGVTEDTITLGLINFRSATRALGPAIADPTTRMLQAYFQWLNDRGGVAGRKLKLLVCDDGGDVTRGRACFEKLQDKVFAFLPGESFVTGGIHEALAKAKVPWLSWGWFTSEWQDPYMFPCHGNGERETANIAEWLAVNVKPKTVGILYLNDAEDIASRDITKKIMKRHGIKVVAEVAQEWDSPDESHHVLAMRAANPDAIVAPTWPTSLAKFFHDAEQQDYAPPMGIYAKHLIADPGQGPIFGEYAKDRFYSINSWIISGGIGNTPEEETLPGNEFMKMLTREYTGYENNGLHMKHMLGHHITQSSVACAVILADVVGQLGPNLTRTGLIDGLESQSFETGMGQTLKWPKGDHDAEPYAFHKEYLYLWTHGDADGFGVKRIRPDPVTPSMAGLTNYPD